MMRHDHLTCPDPRSRLPSRAILDWLTRPRRGGDRQGVEKRAQIAAGAAGAEPTAMTVEPFAAIDNPPLEIGPIGPPDSAGTSAEAVHNWPSFEVQTAPCQALPLTAKPIATKPEPAAVTDVMTPEL